jgi:general secretion pathway protein D
VKEVSVPEAGYDSQSNPPVRPPGPEASGKAGAGPSPTLVVGQFESKVTVTPDPSSNSLVVGAIPEDYRVLESVINQLDERRTQVFVEALILEASTGAAQKIGVELRFPTDPNGSNVQPIGGTTFPVGSDPSVIGGLTQNPFNPPGGLVVGAVDGTIEFNGVQFVNLAGLAQAVQSDNSFNVLSAPHTTTLDNKEAEIVVGENRPFLRSQQSTDVGTVVNSFDFKDVGITMKFTPHIGVGGTVRLDLDVEITNFVSEAQNTPGAVTTTKRSVSTSVLVDSGQMAVIGGLMQDQQTNATARVPCLGSLPLAGWLFKATSRDHRKTNLLIFIQPQILLDRESLERLRLQKQQDFDTIKPRERTLKEDLRDILKQLEQKPPK